MYFRKIRPSTTCLYSAASMWPRSLSAAAHSFCSNPRLAPLPGTFSAFLFAFAMPSPRVSSRIPRRLVRRALFGYAEAEGGNQRRKNESGFRYSFAKASSSMTSTRRSPDSHFDTKGWGRRRARPASTCVSASDGGPFSRIGRRARASAPTEAVKRPECRVLIGGLEAVQGRAAHTKPLCHLHLAESYLLPQPP